MSKTVGVNLKAEIQSGAPIIATCWKIERTDGTVLGFTDWPDGFDYLGTTYNSSGGYERTAINQREGLSVDNMDVVGLIDSSYITEEDLLKGRYRGAKVWIFAVSPGNLGWGEVKLDYGTLGEIHVGEAHFVAEFRSLLTLLNQEFGSKFSRYCRHTLGESKLVSGVETKCGIVLKPADWVQDTAYALGDVVHPGTYNGKRFVCIKAGTSQDNSSVSVDDIVALTGPVSHYRLADQVVDPNWSNVKLLLHCDGSAGGTTFTDSSSSGKTITRGGNTTTETAEKVFGTASARIPGTDDYLSVPYHATDWDFNSKAWTVEFWIRRVSQIQTNGVVIAWTDSGGFGWRILTSSAGNIYMNAGVSMATSWSAGNDSAPVDTWAHCVFCGDSSGNIDIYVDGVRKLSGSGFTHSVPTTDALFIGASNPGTVWESDMYIDDIRITTGTKRYSGTTCPVPDAPYQHSPARVFDFYGANHGSLTNTPILETTAIIPSGNASCADFQSVDSDGVNIDSTDFDNIFDDGGSVIAWALCDTGSTGSHTIISKDGQTASATDNYGGWGLIVDADNSRVNFYIRCSDGVSASSNGRWYTPTNSITLGTVFHVAVTFDFVDQDSDPIIYLNGVAQTIVQDIDITSGHTPKTDSDSVAYIGRRDTGQGGGAVAFDGRVQDVVLYDKVISAGDVVSNYQAGQGNIEPPWNTTNGSSTPDGPVTWKTYDAYTHEGSVTSVTSRFVFTSSGLSGWSNGNFQYGVLEWTSGNNIGVKHDVKKSLSTGEITLRRSTPFDIEVGDAFEVSVGCNHILKMPGDSKGSPYTGDCRAKFNLENGGNQVRFGGEPEMPNIDRIAAPAGSV